MQKLIFLITFCTLTLTHGTSFAYCTHPGFNDTPPNPPGAHAYPHPPFCLKSTSQDCKKWELENYESETENYIRYLRKYAREAQQFSDAASQYAKNADAYAQCEAKNIEEQLSKSKLMP